MLKSSYDVQQRGGFGFDMCRRNKLLEGKGLMPESCRITGTTNVGLVFRHGAFYQQQEVAMEALVDFCRQKTFMVEIILALDGLIAVIQGMAERIGNGSAVLDQSTLMPCALVEKAVFGLLLICQRLLPYKKNLADELLWSLHFVLKLNDRVAHTYCEHITQEVTRLVKANATHIRSQMGWHTIINLLSITARHPDASETGFDVLIIIMSQGGEEAAEKVFRDIGEMWLRLVQGLRKVCLDMREEVRNHTLTSLQRCLMGVVDGVYLDLPQAAWLQCFDMVVFTLLDDLLELSQNHFTKDYRNIEGTLVLAMKLLSKVFLQLLHDLSQLTTFCKLWLGVLTSMEKYMKAKIKGKRSKKLQDLVP
ncbi:hypothetical protein GIB67_003071 [Kingdonia uniflora]|uniref:GBF1-like tetratricopeptide repeats domain-containing protein n=1 Tax=Kingdonia uniflora TaxID=39325 RepID=A0A7J7N5U0_9MAGN|nr:hypothetical protein GIB67_003071 [Kingdonia uniflora]